MMKSGKEKYGEMNLLLVQDKGKVEEEDIPFYINFKHGNTS